MSSLSERLRTARELAALTQQQVADRCGISQASVAGIERGRNVRGSVFLPRIAEALNVNVSWLAEGKGQMRVTTGKEGAQSLVSSSERARYEVTSDRDTAILEVLELMLRSDALGCQLILGAARGAVANYRQDKVGG